jgi:hypothetical protein
MAGKGEYVSLTLEQEVSLTTKNVGFTSFDGLRGSVRPSVIYILN